MFKNCAYSTEYVFNGLAIWRSTSFPSMNAVDPLNGCVATLTAESKISTPQTKISRLWSWACKLEKSSKNVNFKWLVVPWMEKQNNVERERMNEKWMKWDGKKWIIQKTFQTVNYEFILCRASWTIVGHHPISVTEFPYLIAKCFELFLSNNKNFRDTKCRSTPEIWEDPLNDLVYLVKIFHLGLQLTEAVCQNFDVSRYSKGSKNFGYSIGVPHSRRFFGRELKVRGPSATHASPVVPLSTLLTVLVRNSLPHYHSWWFRKWHECCGCLDLSDILFIKRLTRQVLNVSIQNIISLLLWYNFLLTLIESAAWTFSHGRKLN